MIEGNEIISIDPEAYVIDALDFMKRNNIRRIIVSRGNNIIGVFTVDEALYHIINNDIECKLKFAKLKDAVKVNSNSLKDVIIAMVKNNVDSVIFKDKIITYKDVIKAIDWSSVNIPIGEISRQAITIEPYTRIKVAGEIMLKNKIRHLPIYEKSLFGIVSARDIVYNYNEDLDLDISKIMVTDVYKVNKEEPISSVVNSMIRRNIGSVVVINSRGIEIVTLKDLIDFTLRRLIY